MTIECADIAEIMGQPTIAYLGETPWHRLGTPMTGKPNVADALAAAHLDWNVELRSMYIKNDKGNFGIKVRDRRAVVRDVDQKVLATVGAGYVAIQNHEAFGIMNDACEQFGLVIETAGALGKGDRVWMLAKMTEQLEPVPGDKVDGYILIVSGHNGYTAHTGRLTTTRVVCRNTFNVAMHSNDAVFKIPHVKTATEQLELAAIMVTNMVTTLQATGESFKRLAERKLTAAQVDAYVDAVLGIPTMAEIKGRAAARRNEVRRLTIEGQGTEFAPGTAWAAFNAVTEYVDHTRTAKSERILRQADQSAAFGPLAKLKAKAFKLALTV